MAGGNITRIIGGNDTIETENWEVFTEDFNAYAVPLFIFVNNFKITLDEFTRYGKNFTIIPSIGEVFVCWFIMQTFTGI